jgi:hypothetical protein
MAQEMDLHYEQVPCLGLEPTRRTPSPKGDHAFGAPKSFDWIRSSSFLVFIK